MIKNEIVLCSKKIADYKQLIDDLKTNMSVYESVQHLHYIDNNAHDEYSPAVFVGSNHIRFEDAIKKRFEAIIIDFVTTGKDEPD